jgi:GT2 family glycosyltransferase
VTLSLLPVSIIIPTRNRPGLLADAVDSIGRGQDLPAEIVVVDQGDEALALAGDRDLRGSNIEVRVIRLNAAGVSHARNAGADAARHPLLVFTDDDMQADPQWLGAIVRALQAAGPRAVVTGRVLAGEPESDGAFVFATAESAVPATYHGRLMIDVLAGGNMAIEREAFLRHGGYDERLGPGTPFPAAEDNDLGFRLLDAGFHVVYAPDAVLVHRAWRLRTDYLALRFAYGRGKGAFYSKHAHLSDLHTARRMAIDVSRRGVRTVRLLAHPRRALGELAYAAGVISGAAQWTVRSARPRTSRRKLGSIRSGEARP